MMDNLGFEERWERLKEIDDGKAKLIEVSSGFLSHGFIMGPVCVCLFQYHRSP